MTKPLARETIPPVTKRTKRQLPRDRIRRHQHYFYTPEWQAKESGCPPAPLILRFDGSCRSALEFLSFRIRKEESEIPYRGYAYGNVVRLDGDVSLPEGTAVTVEVEDPAKGSPQAVLHVMRSLPDIDPAHVDELDNAIALGKLPIRSDGVFDRKRPSRRWEDRSLQERNLQRAFTHRCRSGQDIRCGDWPAPSVRTEPVRSLNLRRSP